MAIERFEKVEIISHISSKERLIEELQAKGLVEIIDISAHKREPGANGDVSERIERVEFLLNTLEGYTEKGGMFGGLFQEKVSVSEAELGKVVDSLDIQKVYEGCRSLVKRLERLNSEESNLSLIGESILPWRDLRLSCMELEGTVRVGLAVGTIASRGFSSFEKEIGKMPGVFIKVISRGRALTHCLLGFMRADEPDISAAFARLGFQTETLPPVPDELAALKFEQCLLKINARLAELRSERNSLNKQMRELTPLLPSARVVYDYLCSLRHREKVDELFGKTETTFTICGWVRRRDIKSLRRLIGERFQEAEIGIKKIKDSDIPPTSLQNNRLVKPFEAVVDLYGLPNSRELDPTPLLAPFFVLFFGLCLTDAGYGAVLSILSWLGLRKFKGLMVRKLLRLLFLSGIVTIFLGLLTGGVFGLEFKAAKFFMLIDPMKDFLVFLLVSIGIGFIQVWYGFLINMLKELRRGTAETRGRVLLRGLSWLVFLPGIIILGVVKQPEMVSLGLLSESPLGDAWGYIAPAMTLGGVCGIFLEAGMDSKGILKRTFLGLYGLYGIVGCFGDILSYVRLFALGLATVAMAIAVNTISDFVKGVPVFGYILMPVFFVVGHIANLFINALSGFIHTLRLQFVEFFTKFYEGGGRAFQPFVREGRYTTVGLDKE